MDFQEIGGSYFIECDHIVEPTNKIWFQSDILSSIGYSVCCFIGRGNINKNVMFSIGHIKDNTRS
jgi:hypothetical protein